MKRIVRPQSSLNELRILNILSDKSLRFNELERVFGFSYGYTGISLYHTLQTHIRNLIKSESISAEGNRNRTFSITKEGLRRLALLE